MTNQENIELIKDLIKLAIELGANPLYINKLLFINGMTQQEAIYNDLLQGETKWLKNITITLLYTRS